MHPHVIKEVEFTLPPPGLLMAQARGTVNAELVAVLKLTDRPASSDDIRPFAEALAVHAQTEMAVKHPDAMLVGKVVRQRLGVLPAARA